MTGDPSHKAETLTARNIVNAYRSAFYSATGKYPTECRHLEGRWFQIDGVQRDRRWVIYEVERLRKEALLRAADSTGTGDRRGLLQRIIGRLARPESRKPTDELLVKCATCGHVNVGGALRCQGCGNSLTSDPSIDETLDRSAVTAPEAQAIPRPPGSGTAEFPENGTLLLNVAGNYLRVPSVGTVFFGR
ncbi:MAG: hypothetical protein GY778_17910, partial [bacterium]|nr:hypothetical protein [bacterium]